MRMNTVEENRRQNLKSLVQEYGSQVALSNAIKKSTAQISQWINASKYANSEKRRAMESTTAREIERVTGKSNGWMDQPPLNHSVIEGSGLTNQEQNLINSFRMLDSGLQQIIVSLVVEKAPTEKNLPSHPLPKKSQKAA